MGVTVIFRGESRVDVERVDAFAEQPFQRWQVHRTNNVVWLLQGDEVLDHREREVEALVIDVGSDDEVLVRRVLVHEVAREPLWTRLPSAR